MRILISSNSFYPNIGGSEVNAEVLASEFHKSSHHVKVVTRTVSKNKLFDESNFQYKVIRDPSFHKTLKLVKWCDVFFQNGISLRDIWPLLFLRRPWIIRHGSYIRTIKNSKYTGGIGGITNDSISKIKYFLLRYSISISISKEIAKHLNYPSFIVTNPYRDYLFRRISNIPKINDLVYVGRLVSDKGVDMLLESLYKLKDFQLFPKLTIVGTGPELFELKNLSVKLNIDNQVVFEGLKIGEELVKIMNKNKIMVIPSVYDEPFGVVALEGIACGCVIVGSNGGGLKDAIGPCGITFPNGEVDTLTKILKSLLKEPNKLKNYTRFASKHLEKHKPILIAKKYLRIFKKHYLNFNS